MIPEVTVVIPTYNSAYLLRRAIRSVLEQTFTDWEILVIDNNSTDSTDEVLCEIRDTRIRVLKVRNEGVIAVSRNLGVREARGRWVAFLDADDWWDMTKLEESVDALRRGADVVYHDLRCVRRGLLNFRKLIRSRQLSCPVRHDLIKNGNALLNSSVVIDRSLLVAVGGQDEDPNLIAAEDYDCWIRVANITEKFCRIPRVLGSYWISDSNVSSPKRAICWLSAIKDRYINVKELHGVRTLPHWYSLAMVKSCIRLSDYAQAKRFIHLSLANAKERGFWHQSKLFFSYVLIILVSVNVKFIRKSPGPLL